MAITWWTGCHPGNGSIGSAGASTAIKPRTRARGDEIRRLTDAHPAFRVRGRLIKRSLSSIAGSRAYPTFVGVQSDIRAMVFWYLVVLGSYRPERADTGADTAP
jgi:hypothetical protein